MLIVKTKKNMTLNPVLVSLAEKSLKALGMSSLSEFVDNAMREYLEGMGIETKPKNLAASIQEEPAVYRATKPRSSTR